MACHLPNVSFEYVPEECRMKIANTLDCEGLQNYKIFAQRLDAQCDCSLGFDSAYLNALHFRRPTHGPTYEVLLIIAKMGISVPVVYQVLRDMGLQVSEVLVQYQNEIMQRYQARQRVGSQGRPDNGARINRCSCHQCIRHWSCNEADTQTGNIAPNLPESRRVSSTSTNNGHRIVHNLHQNSHQIRNDNWMNDLSLTPVPKECPPSQVPSFNISSIAPPAPTNEDTGAACLCPNDFLPPSDFEDDYICESCENSRMQNSDETDRKIYLHTSLQPNCPSCSTRYANSTESTQSVYRRPSRDREITAENSDNRRLSDSDVPSQSSQDLRRSKSHEDWKNTDLKCTCGQQRIPATVQSQRKQMTLFVSFAQDSKAHVACVFDLIKQLKERGFKIRCDMYHELLVKITLKEYEEKQENTNDWLQRNFEDADYIIFCLSPLYYEYTKPSDYNPSWRDGVGQAVGSQPDPYPSNDQLHAKYIYNQAHVEHMNALCRNRRFLPVLFKGSRATRDHVPAIFKSTNVYSYPDVGELLWFLGRVVQDGP